jgi:hypothetical protein
MTLDADYAANCKLDLSAYSLITHSLLTYLSYLSTPVASELALIKAKQALRLHEIKQSKLCGSSAF